MYKLATIITLAVLTMMCATIINYNVTVVDTTITMEPVNYCSTTEVFNCYRILK